MSLTFPKILHQSVDSLTNAICEKRGDNNVKHDVRAMVFNVATFAAIFFSTISATTGVATLAVLPIVGVSSGFVLLFAGSTALAVASFATRSFIKENIMKSWKNWFANINCSNPNPTWKNWSIWANKHPWGIFWEFKSFS